jgi:hypothetical protein
VQRVIGLFISRHIHSSSISRDYTDFLIRVECGFPQVGQFVSGDWNRFCIPIGSVPMKITKTKILFQTALLLLAVSFYQKHVLPMTLNIQPACLTEPVQAETDKAPFNIDMKGIDYRVTPLYTYEISGLIPSVLHYTQWIRSDFYERHGDNANIADIALLWGPDNTNREILKHFKFSHSGAFVTWRTRRGAKPVDWRKFNQDQVSNNHILSDSKLMINKLRKLRKWDQVHLKGYLVSYDGGTTRNRRSSTTRTDTGNGACEVFYVTDLEVLKKSSLHVWGWVHNISWGLLLLAIIIHFRKPIAF